MERSRVMTKKVRNAVRTFLIKDSQVVCIRYKMDNVGWIDIPGGKIEMGETPQMAAVREFQEETGIGISELERLGKIIIEYPDRIYNIEVFVANEYNGSLQEFDENESFWIPIKDLLMMENRYAITYLLQKEFQNELETKSIHVKFLVDENHKVLEYSRI